MKVENEYNKAQKSENYAYPMVVLTSLQNDATKIKGSICESVLTAESNLRIKKIELAQSLDNTKAKKKKILFVEKNIAVQNRTLKLHQRDIENHCCICGGVHRGNDHILTRKTDCSLLKMKQRVAKYLQQSLKESNVRLDEYKGILDKGFLENTEAKLNMNQSLISFIESACVL